jgi:hypothetical protein
MGELIEFFFTALVIYFIYKFVVDLVLPVSKATSGVRNKIKEMQQMQEEEMRRQRNNASNNQAQSSAYKGSSVADKEGDYIDFEEVK